MDSFCFQLLEALCPASHRHCLQPKTSGPTLSPCLLHFGLFRIRVWVSAFQLGSYFHLMTVSLTGLKCSGPSIGVQGLEAVVLQVDPSPVYGWGRAWESTLKTKVYTQAGCGIGGRGAPFTTLRIPFLHVACSSTWYTQDDTCHHILISQCNLGEAFTANLYTVGRRYLVCSGSRWARTEVKPAC